MASEAGFSVGDKSKEAEATFALIYTAPDGFWQSKTEELYMFKGYKTYILGGLAILGSAAGYLVGDMSLPDAIQAGITAAMGMTIRHGITTTAAK